MDDNPHDNQRLKIQSAAFILLVGGMLIGLGGVLVDLYPRFPLPPQLDLSLEGGVAVLLIGAGYSAVILSCRTARVVLAIAMALFGVHAIDHHLSPHVAIGHDALPLVPAILLVLFGLCCALGLQTVRRRRAWRVVGWLGAAMGALSLLTHVWPPVRLATASLFAEIEVLGGLLAIAFGVILHIAAREHGQRRLELSRRALKAGFQGVLASLLVWLLGSWAFDVERREEARGQVDHLTATLEQVVQDHTSLLLRFAERWGVEEELPGRVMREVEAASYLRDVPSLQALLVIGPASQVQWRRSRSPEALQWGMDALVDVQTLSWLADLRASSHRVDWRFPDDARPRLAMLAVRDRADASRVLLAVVDVTEMVGRYMRQAANGYRIVVASGEQRITTLNAPQAVPSGPLALLAGGELALPQGPDLRVQAFAAPPAVLTLAGGLPPALGVIGLLFTYQLMMGLSLARIRANQARALEVKEQRFRSLFTQNPDVVLCIDPDGTVRDVNPATQTVLANRPEALVGRHYREALPGCASEGEGTREVTAAFECARGGRSQSFDLRCDEGGRMRVFEANFMPILVQGQVEGVFGMFKDVSEHVTAQEELRIMRRSLEASSNGVSIVDVRGAESEVVYVNPAFASITGYAPAEVVGRRPIFLSGPETDRDDIESVAVAIRERRSLALTLRNYRKDGTPFWNQLFLSPVRSPEGEVTHFVAVMNDISLEKAQEARLAYQATHDVLTGLPNRALFNDRLAHDLELARRSGRTLGVLFIDLDEFKPINDTLGHKVGDRLLVSVAGRLGHCLRHGDTLARLGGDEFVLLLPDIAHEEEAEEVAERLLDELSRTHRVEGHDLHVSASIGIATLEEGGIDDAEKLIQQADMAMYQAKQQGRNAYQRFSPDLDGKLAERVSVRSELQEALEREQLQLFYQPLVDRQGRVEGAEALIRWHHPEKGWMAPAQFIPLAEETGQIVELSRWVMRRAFRDTRRLVGRGLLRGRVAINLSPLQFHRPNFLTQLRRMLEEAGLATQHVELELTEGTLMRDKEGAIDILNALTGMGISTAIDDFGTGYSSLAYLRTLPIDKIKIDRSFTLNVADDDKDAAVCKGVITLARELELKVLAEGVETSAQYDYLLGLGCEAFQGYHFARPMPFDDLVTHLEQERVACP